jgi:hypothetical protein
MVAARYTVAFILLTSNISAIYDGIDNDAFSVSFSFDGVSHHLLNPITQAHVEAIGPAAFTLINSLPVFIVQGLLCFEMIHISGSVVIGLLLVILILSPGLLQIVGNVISLYRASNLSDGGPEGSDHVK